jgi:hypothetical protein
VSPATCNELITIGKIKISIFTTWEYFFSSRDSLIG